MSCSLWKPTALGLIIPSTSVTTLRWKLAPTPPPQEPVKKSCIRKIGAKVPFSYFLLTCGAGGNPPSSWMADLSFVSGVAKTTRSNRSSSAASDTSALTGRREEDTLASREAPSLKRREDEGSEEEEEVEEEELLFTRLNATEKEPSSFRETLLTFQ